MGLKKLVKQVLIHQQNKAYINTLASKTIPYHQWIQGKEQQDGEWLSGGEVELVYLISSKGRPAEHMEPICQNYFAKHPECMLAYGDEDVWENGEQERKSPWFRPDWSPDLLDTCFYFGSVVVLRKDFYEHAIQELGAVPSEKWNWVRECTKLMETNSIAHIPRILFHCNQEEVLQNYAEGSGAKTTELFDPKKHMLSIIIPSKDHPELLEKCLCGIQNVRGTQPLEIIVVDNGSNRENKLCVERLLQQYSTEQCETIYKYVPMEFHFSRMCNLGAEIAKGNLFLFLNDDVELCQKGCLEKMIALAARPYTGAVGMKLYYPQSIKIQHAGITNLPMGPVHKLQFLEDDIAYYFNSNRGLRNVLAVTAACLMVEKEKFFQAGGFSDELQVAFNDVDLCFQLYELGYHNVCMNDSFAYHYESVSRGSDEAPEKLKRLLEERETLYRRHSELENVDPYFSDDLSKQGLDTRIRAAYETAGNTIQKVTTELKQKNLTACSQDECVMLRIESLVGGNVQGYGVVLGDNNACYEKELAFVPVQGGHILQETGYVVALEGQYRPDLIENMPDQVHVGLSGFALQLPDSLPVGTYQIAMAVRNRVTGLSLWNVSNRYITKKEE